jgi:hypothetical protein
MFRSRFVFQFNTQPVHSREILRENPDSIGGWVRETGEIYKEINAQIDQAFENCEVALKSAGGKGWSQVRYYTSSASFFEQGADHRYTESTLTMSLLTMKLWMLWYGISRSGCLIINLSGLVLGYLDWGKMI